MEFKTIAKEIGDLVTVKNEAYGNSFAKCGEFLRLLFPTGIQPEQYDDALAMVRIFDKQMRIATRKDAFGESPYRDIAGYGLLGAAKDEVAAPLPGSARYEEIHAELTEGEKQCAACWHVLGACPSLGGNCLGGCAYFTLEAPVTAELTGKVAEPAKDAPNCAICMVDQCKDASEDMAYCGRYSPPKEA